MPSTQPSLPAPVTPADRDARLGWWREARFGMFVHWGVYATLGGTWHGKPYIGYAEHIQRGLKIPIPAYREEVAGQFNPSGFNADELVRLARETGAGYLVVTAKHHDGFAMFDSKVSDATVVKATPLHRDVIAEIRDACRRQGVRFGVYYSHAFDWGEPDAPGNDWDYNNPGGDLQLHGAQWWKTYPAFLPVARRYVDRKCIPQILELIRDYKPDLMWFDTPNKLPPEENLRILAAVRQAAPLMVVNSRILSTNGTALTDYLSTADRPAEFPQTPGDWEAVPTTNESYGYNANDHSHKTPTHFIRLLAKAAARGGNVLLNVGPRGDGSIDPPDAAIFSGIGTWWSANGQSIRGTTRTPLPVQTWGESTLRGNTLYLHVFRWPSSGELVVGGLRDAPRSATLLKSGATLSFVQGGLDLKIKVPTAAPDASDSVIALAFDSKPAADDVRLVSSDGGDEELRSLDGEISGGLHYGPGKSSDAWVNNWRSTKAAVTWKLRAAVGSTRKYEVELWYDAPQESKLPKFAEGDAGAERIVAHAGAGGTVRLVAGSQVLRAEVRQGRDVRVTVGQISLPDGMFDLRVEAEKIDGEELFRLRSVVLRPVRE